MIKRMMVKLVLAMLLVMSQNVFAGSGLLFKVSATGTPANVSITLCLNGKGPVSCQNYTVSASSLTISPVISNHVYPFIGIKINTPGYTLGNLGLDCAPGSNGYCLFSASQSQAKTISLVVNGALTLSSSLNPSVYNQSVIFTAAVSPNDATGTVTFTDGGTTIGSGTLSSGIATFTTSTLTAGTHNIVATYAGDSNFDDSTSNTVSQVVNVANQAITYTSTAPSATVGGATYTPTAISTSGLTVAITVDASSSSICTISGGVVSFIAAGTCTLDANQAGNSNYNAATQVQQAVTVVTPTPTTTVVYSSSNPSAASSSVTLSANVSSDNGTPNSGTVGFTSNGSSISGCTEESLTSGIATCTTSILSTGTDAIVATYTGGSTFAASTSASFSQSVVATVTATVPAAPQDVTAIPGNGQVVINWYPPANTGGAAITGYTVKYGTTASATYTTAGCTTSSASGLSCTVSSGLTNGTPYTFTVVASNADGTGPTAFSSSVTPESTLTASPANLALSGLGSGASRTITITNNSGSPVIIASVSTPSPSLPSGTSINTSQANACVPALELASGGSCTITIAPGSTVTSGAGSALCTTGIAPTPSVITVTDNNSDTVSANVVVLGYGCQYQEGYLFSIDDTTPTTSSIGGKVVTLSDLSSGIVWSSDTVSIWGIDDASTIGNPSPNASSGEPATLTTGQLNCDAVNDGACATNNVYVHYGAVSNAVGLCKATISGYTDWYLPSVCELGPFGSTGLSTGNYPSLTNSQTCTTGSTNIQNQLVTTSIVTNFSVGLYWSPTEASSGPQARAWLQFFASTGSEQGFSNKGGLFSVRCSRALTF